MFMESIKDISRAFESSSGAVLPNFRLHNPEAEEKLFRIMKVREELQGKIVVLQKDVATRTVQATNLTDEILNIARILRSDIKVLHRKTIKHNFFTGVDSDQSG